MYVLVLLYTGDGFITYHISHQAHVTGCLLQVTVAANALFSIYDNCPERIGTALVVSVPPFRGPNFV
jgi:hypothetical protein